MKQCLAAVRDPEQLSRADISLRRMADAKNSYGVALNDEQSASHAAALPVEKLARFTAGKSAFARY